MELSKQVCTLEQAKRLKELGVAQESHFYWWFVYRLGNDWIYELGPADEGDKVNSKWSAYTVAELGEMLPLGYHTATRDFGYDDWLCWDEDHEGISGLHAFKTEAEARAAMLIRLIESQSSSIEDINKRLKQ